MRIPLHDSSITLFSEENDDDDDGDAWNLPTPWPLSTSDASTKSLLSRVAREHIRSGYKLCLCLSYSLLQNRKWHTNDDDDDWYMVIWSVLHHLRAAGLNSWRLQSSKFMQLCNVHSATGKHWNWKGHCVCCSVKKQHTAGLNGWGRSSWSSTALTMKPNDPITRSYSVQCSYVLQHECNTVQPSAIKLSEVQCSAALCSIILLPSGSSVRGGAPCIENKGIEDNFIFYIDYRFFLFQWWN